MPGSDEYYLYETNEKGEQVLVKSLRSEKKAYIRFVNRTTRPVSVWWRDYNGHRQHYVIMPPNSYYNTDTYISHPWEFTDACTQERYVINNKQIFRAPECIANVQTRTTWYITIGVRSLLSTVMLSVASRLNNVEHVDALGLPKMLANELKSLVDKLRTQVVINHARR